MAQITESRNIDIINKWQNRVKRGFLWITILKLYNEKDPLTGEMPKLSGTDLKVSISNLHRRWDPSPGSIYPILKQLEEDRLITQVDETDKKNKAYEITILGSELLTTLRDNVFALRMHPVEALKRMSKSESDFKQKFSSMIDDLSPDEIITMQEHFKIIQSWFDDILKSKLSQNKK